MLACHMLTREPLAVIWSIRLGVRAWEPSGPLLHAGSSYLFRPCQQLIENPVGVVPLHGTRNEKVLSVALVNPETACLCLMGRLRETQLSETALYFGFRRDRRRDHALVAA